MSYFCVTEFQCSSVLTLLYVHVSGCANLCLLRSSVSHLDHQGEV